MGLLEGRDLFYSTAPIIAVTTNGYTRWDGKLVMGQGAAKEAATRWPWLPRAAGRIVSRLRGLYGFVVVPPPPDITAPLVGLFQVKHHFRDPADIRLIRDSCRGLMEWLRTSFVAYRHQPGPIVAVNYPGIGNGRLARREVEPVIAPMLESPFVEVYIR